MIFHNNNSVHAFREVLFELISERFPSTEIYEVKGSDYIKDQVLELRQDGKSLRYSPYEMYISSEDYENAILELLEKWDNLLENEG